MQKKEARAKSKFVMFFQGSNYILTYLFLLIFKRDVNI